MSKVVTSTSGSELLLLTTRMLQSAMDEIAPALNDLKLDPKSLFLLNQLDAYPYPAELARVLMLPSPTVTFLVKRMEAAGYIRRETDAKDLRKYRLTLTAKGRKVMERGRRILDDSFGARLEKLRDGEVETFRRLIAALS